LPCDLNYDFCFIGDFMDLIKQYTDALDAYSKIALTLSDAISSLSALQSYITNVPAMTSPKHEVAFRCFIEDVVKEDVYNHINTLKQYKDDAYATCDNYKYALDNLKEQAEKENNHLQKLRSKFQVGREYLIQTGSKTEHFKIINKFRDNDKLYVVVAPAFVAYEVLVEADTEYFTPCYLNTNVYSKNLILTNEEKAGGGLNV
jgi:hypothetical protein